MKRVIHKRDGFFRVCNSSVMSSVDKDRWPKVTCRLCLAHRPIADCADCRRERRAGKQGGRTK